MKVRPLVVFFSRRLSRLLKFASYLAIFLLFYFFYVIRIIHQSKEDSSLRGDYGAEIVTRDPFASYKGSGKKNWHEHSAMERDALRTGRGEGGKELKLVPSGATARIIDELYRENGYNAYISDMISLNRSVRDIRHEQCHSISHLERLPSVSVIFPFHNEHNSTLLRSIYSVINRSPKEILKEIIIVDDGSTKDFLKEPLDKYLKDTGLDRLVTVVRNVRREGLIRARLLGAHRASGEIFVFLDSHSEVNYNWLPPLIEPITFNYRTAVCPFVDVIDCDTFEYREQDNGGRGSFDWEFNYKRLPLLNKVKQNRTEPFDNPVMAGGYFAISKEWFWELGGYDEELAIWGGEQYELSFKIWQCHGRLVDAPCSRVGHIYRCKYVPFGNPGIGDFVSRNYKRVAEVWMDEYKEMLYHNRPMMREVDEGDLSIPKGVRQRLRCKSFDWFMKNVAFDQDYYYPFRDRPQSAEGEIRSVDSNKCIDSSYVPVMNPIGLRECEGNTTAVRAEQKFRLTERLDIRPKYRDDCFDVSKSDPGTEIVLYKCHGMHGNQRFNYLPKTQQLFHPISGLCVDCIFAENKVLMNSCDSRKRTQKWVWSSMNLTLIEERNQIVGLKEF